MVDFSSQTYGGVPRSEPRGGPRGVPKIFLSHNFIIFNILKVDIFKFDLDFDIDYSKRGSLLVRPPLGLVSWGVPWRGPPWGPP